jgi:low affinity Fe/Cu permease
MAETNHHSSQHTGTNSFGPHAPQNHLNWFERFARRASMLAGKPAAFFSALAIVVVWLATGPIFGFTDTWQLIINTGTTIVTFLMVFLLQHTQNRDTLALQVKLADLIIAVKGADNKLATAEDLSEHELAELHASYAHRAQQTLERLEAKRRAQADRPPALDRRQRPRAS